MAPDADVVATGSASHVLEHVAERVRADLAQCSA